MFRWIPIKDAPWISDERKIEFDMILRIICLSDWAINIYNDVSHNAGFLKCSHGFTFIANHVDVDNITILHTTYVELKKQYTVGKNV